MASVDQWEDVPASEGHWEDTSEPKPAMAKSGYEGIADGDLNFLQKAERAAEKVGLVKPGMEMLSPDSLEQKRLALKTAANTLTAGYVPQLVASTKTGSLSSDDYLKERDAQVADLAKAEGGTKAAGVALGALPTLASGSVLPAAKSVGKRILQGGAVAGAIAAASNPGDEAGKIDPLQLPERAKNAAIGTVVGGALTAVGAAPEIADKLKRQANMRALKAGGAMLKDYRGFNRKDLIDDASTMLLEPVQMPKGQEPVKVVTPGATLEDVAHRTGQVMDAHGQVIGEVESALDKNFDKLSKSYIGEKLFHPQRAADRLEAELIAPNVGTKMENATGEVSDLVQNLRDMGDGPARFGEAKKQLKALDQFLKYSKEMTPEKELLKQARGILNSEVEKGVDAVGQASNFPLYDKWKQSKKIYGFMSDVNAMANDKLLREGANRFISPSDYGAGLATMTASAAGHGQIGPREGVTGIVAGSVNHVMRKYGNAMAANLANAGAKTLTSPAVGQAASYVASKALPMTAAGIQSKAAMQQPKNRDDALMERVVGSEYEAPLKAAQSRGPQAFASTYYLLSQSHPEFRKLVDDDEH